MRNSFKALQRERKYVENFESDLVAVFRSPSLLYMFYQMYPRRYFEHGIKVLSELWLKDGRAHPRARKESDLKKKRKKTAPVSRGKKKTRKKRKKK